MFLGDMSCQLAEYDEALKAYRGAIENGLADTAATPRVMYASLRAGRPAAAAAEVARRLEKEERFIPHDLLQTIEYLSEVPSVVPRLERLLAAAGRDRISPLGLQRLMIARSVLRPRAGAHELRRFVEAHPTADEVISRWLALLPDRERARHVVDVYRRAPPEAGPGLARQLLLSVGTCEAILDHIEGDESDAASIVAARVLLAAGDEKSADLVATAVRDRTEPHAAFLIAELAARKGDWRTADSALLDLARRGESWPIVQALLLLQRPTEAFEIAESTMGSGHVPATTLWVDRLHIAARAAVSARRFDVAMSWLESARSLDRHDLRAMDAMLQIVGENGPAPDEARHGELVRELLSKHAESDLVMLYRARELLSTRRLAQAEQILLRLAEMRPNDPAVLLQLHRAWTEGVTDPARTERAERWIRERLGACPDHPDLTEMLARIVAFAGRIDEAERILRDALQRRPSVPLARALEQLLMQQPARAEEGRQLWLSRLSTPHIPIGEAIQLARYHAESGEGAESPRVLNRHIPHRAELTPEQTAVIRELLQAAAFDIIAEGNVEDVHGFIDAALLTRTLDDFAAGDPRHGGPSQLAYIFAVNMFAAGREDESIQTYRLALSYNPDHAWALNNLGYTLLERGDVVFAAPLIERAYVLLPDEPNVIDSIGWLRFRQGVIEDEQVEGSIREGAATLLERAAGQNPRSATIQDHLGDALWAAGRKEEAISAWQRAETLLDQSIEAARSDGRLADTEDIERRAAVRHKLQAALSGADPLAP
jgi:tetratricopeptide (TPR) repeat protein